MRLRYSDVTPQNVYQNRRRFLSTAIAAGAATALGPYSLQAAELAAKKTGYGQGDKLTPQQITTSYNNFYEFGTGKNEPVEISKKWTVPSPWEVQIGGEVAKPKRSTSTRS